MVLEIGYTCNLYLPASTYTIKRMLGMMVGAMVVMRGVRLVDTDRTGRPARVGCLSPTSPSTSRTPTSMSSALASRSKLANVYVDPQTTIRAHA